MDSTKTKSADEKFCIDCGTVIKQRAEICPFCGIRQPVMQATATQPTSRSKSKLAAALFALFLGGLGIHKFYLGQIGWGVLYLLFFWTLIPAFVGFVESIMLLVMSDEKFDRRFNVR